MRKNESRMRSATEQDNLPIEKNQAQRVPLSEVPILLTKNQLMSKLQVGNTSVWEWMCDGMPHYKRGSIVRFDLQQVLNWLAVK